MNFVKIILVCLFVSCSCNKGDYPISDFNMVDEVVSSVIPDTIETKSDAVDVKSDSQRVMQNEIKVDTIQSTNSRTDIHFKKAKKTTRKVTYRKIRKLVKKKYSGCMGLTGNPLTTEDAANCAMHHWERAKELFSIGNLDSAYRHCIRGISLYENGSLFCLKAEILNTVGKTAAALEAANVAIDRKDYWRVGDREQAMYEKCYALSSLYEKYPSNRIKEKMLKNCEGIRR